MVVFSGPIPGTNGFSLNPLGPSISADLSPPWLRLAVARGNRRRLLRTRRRLDPGGPSSSSSRPPPALPCRLPTAAGETIAALSFLSWSAHTHRDPIARAHVWMCPQALDRNSGPLVFNNQHGFEQSTQILFELLRFICGSSWSLRNNSDVWGLRRPH